ncbi:helix-turn-helix domain-containing protein [Nocardioides sp. W7]|uniref:helix-turn-helix transcriptional regulator n=1 Tax=Nocardioides sp. W7 TaxID=2931390 RepID=UPI001FD19FD4|nr:helix-turn-helix domain-containing protein [Nocardioides sp. W7]
METSRDAAPDQTTSVVTLAQLADELSVPVKTLYDLRSKGRGPRGFRIGRQLRFRRAEVEAWLASLETDDAHRHPRRERG